MTSKDIRIEECQKINKVNSEGKKQDQQSDKKINAERILGNMKHISLIQSVKLQEAHQDVIQGSIKLKNYTLEWLFQPSKLAKFDSL